MKIAYRDARCIFRRLLSYLFIFYFFIYFRSSSKIWVKELSLNRTLSSLFTTELASLVDPCRGLGNVLRTCFFFCLISSRPKLHALRTQCFVYLFFWCHNNTLQMACLKGTIDLCVCVCVFLKFCSFALQMACLKQCFYLFLSCCMSQSTYRVVTGSFATACLGRTGSYFLWQVITVLTGRGHLLRSERGVGSAPAPE